METTQQAERTQPIDGLIHQSLEELRRRITHLEQGYQELKEVRLRSAELRHDVDSLQHTAKDLEASLKAARHQAGQGGASEGFASVGDADETGHEVADEVGYEASVASASMPGEPPRPEDLETDPSTHGGVALSDTGKSSLLSRRRPSNVRRYSGLGSLSTYGQPQSDRQAQGLSQAQLQLLEALDKRMGSIEGRLEDESSQAGLAEQKHQELEQTLAALEERLQTVDVDYRGHAKVVNSRLDFLAVAEEHRKDEDVKCAKSWNLANQVDVIQSVVAQEMRHVKADLIHAVQAHMQNSLGKAIALGEEPRSGMRAGRHSASEAHGADDASKQDLSSERREMDEKIKRLQDCYQQITLKLAALKSAQRATDQQATISGERAKKLAEELEHVMEQAARSEVRLEWLVVNPAAVAATTPGAGGTPRSGAGGTTSVAGGTPRSVGGGKHPSLSGVEEETSTPLTAVRGQRNWPPLASSPSGAGTPSSRVGGSIFGHARPRRSNGGPRASQQVETPPDIPGMSLSRAASVDTAPELDFNTGRIVRLGKKVSDLDGEFSSQFRVVKEDLELLSQKMAMMTAFLPRKQRRLVERILAAGSKNKEEEAAEEDKGEKKPKDGSEPAKRVQFSEKLLETRTYQVVEDQHQMPWQFVGEPDQKWYWCFQPLSEMGGALASHFEQMEHERMEFEAEVAESFERLREQLNSAGATATPQRPNKHRGLGPRALWDRRADAEERGSPAPRSEEDGDSGFDLSGEGLEKLGRRIENSVLPQLTALEDRIERLVGDLRELKKSQEKDRSDKVDRDELQLLAMRVAVFDRLDLKQLDTKLEQLEGSGKYSSQLLEQLSEQLQRLEANAVHRNDLAKVKNEHSVFKVEHQKLQTSVNDLSTSIYGANRQLSTMLGDVKTSFEQGFFKIEKEKVSVVEYNALFEKMTKLEGSMRDNRQILGGAGGQEVNAFVKRIILNMEDKLMVLEKKVDLLTEGRPADATPQGGPVPGGLLAAATATATATTSAQDAQLQTLGAELSTMTQAVTQLRQEINLSKVDMEQILMQGQLQADLAQKLNVYVEKAAPGDGPGAGGTEDEPGTILSLTRVQVMISAAARQLVAGNKWVTKEAFDSRIAEMRKEYMNGARQLQAQIEDVGSTMLRSSPAAGGAGNAGPKLPKMLAKRQLAEGGAETLEWPPALAVEAAPDKQGRYPGGRPPGSAPAAITGAGGAGGLGASTPRRLLQQRPVSDKSARGSSHWGG